jgi:uncharacterized protein YcbK (DUF882 family)
MLRMSTNLNRRTLLAAAAAGATPMLGIPAAAQAAAGDGVRRIALLNLHTGEAFKEVYFANGSYITDALEAAARALRDWRTGEVHRIDPKLFDLMSAVQARLEVDRPYQIISGYRSPKTNAALHERSSGVATKSLHMLGQAVDVRIAGVELQNLHKAALSLKAGGVGYYPKSNFVHIDVGRPRQWTGA